MTIAWCKDTGILAKMLSKIRTANTEHMPIPRLQTKQPLSFWHILPILVMFAIGMGISIIVYFIEKIRPLSATSSRISEQKTIEPSYELGVIQDLRPKTERN